MTTLMRRAGRYIVICVAATASSFYEVNELNHTVSQSVKLVSYDEDQLVVLDSVGTVCDVATETRSPAVHGCASSAETQQSIVRRRHDRFHSSKRGS
jgi:hypothetical protein